MAHIQITNEISVIGRDFMDHRFKLGDQDVVVSVLQTRKTVWVASGAFEGSTVEVKGSSSANALDRWRKVALRQGD